VLENTKIHICFLDGHNIAFYIKASINQIFGLVTALGIPDV